MTKHADKSSSDGAGGAVVKAEITMWGAAVERMKVILLVLAISARMDGPVPSVDHICANPALRGKQG